MTRTLTILLAATLLLASLGMSASPVMAADSTGDPITELDTSSDGPITESTDGPITELSESTDGPITAELLESTDGPITASAPITSTDVGTQGDCDSKTDPVCE